MKVSYDREVGVLRLIFTSAAIFESDEEKAGVVIDYDEQRNVVAMEILDASTRVENPPQVNYKPRFAEKKAGGEKSIGGSISPSNHRKWRQ